LPDSFQHWIVDGCNAVKKAVSASVFPDISDDCLVDDYGAPAIFDFVDLGD